jgi:hypothetical protein
LEIRQGPAKPSFRHVWDTNSFRFSSYHIFRLTLRTDEKDDLSFFRDFLSDLKRFLKHALCFQKIDNVDTITFTEDILFHLRIPSACLVAKMQACLEHLLK